MFDFDTLALLVLIVLALVTVARATMSINIGYTLNDNPSGDAGSFSQTFIASYTGETPIIRTWAIPALTTDEENEITFTVANLDAIIIQSDRDITIKENSSGTPTATFTLKAGVPFEWHKDSGITVPFVGTAGIVTKFFISNPHATLAASVKVRGLA